MAKVSQRSLVQRLDAASAEMSMSPAQLEQLDSLDLVHVFARCCDNHEKLSTTLVDIVKILRERRFYVDTPHEASTVRDLIKSANQKKADTIQRYVSSLVKCLRMPPHVFKSMPSISITHLKLPNVKWYGVGDDVDMYISAAWSHAIVIETKDVVATNVNDVHIQWKSPSQLSKVVSHCTGTVANALNVTPPTIRMCRPLKEAYEELIISSMPEFQQKQLEYRVKKVFLCVCVCVYRHLRP